MFGPSLKRVGPDRYVLRLPALEREVLRQLTVQLKESLEQPDDPSLRRLFPPAYPDDPKKEREYRRLVGYDLLASRQAALDTMVETASATDLSEEQVTAWLSALNDLRLVLGTRLDLKEEDELDADTPGHAEYGFLTYLEDMVITALAGQFD